MFPREARDRCVKARTPWAYPRTYTADGGKQHGNMSSKIDLQRRKSRCVFGPVINQYRGCCPADAPEPSANPSVKRDTISRCTYVRQTSSVLGGSVRWFTDSLRRFRCDKFPSNDEPKTLRRNRTAGNTACYSLVRTARTRCNRGRRLGTPCEPLRYIIIIIIITSGGYRGIPRRTEQRGSRDGGSSRGEGRSRRKWSDDYYYYYIILPPQ